MGLCCQVRRLAEKYFGGWQRPAVVSSASAAAQATGSGVAAAGVVGVAAAAAGANGAWWDGEQLPRPAVPPGGGAELLYKEKARAGPAVMLAFYRPSARSEDSLVLEMVRWEWTPCQRGACCARCALGLV